MLSKVDKVAEVPLPTITKKRSSYRNEFYRGGKKPMKQIVLQII
jgi:hypothetical protein